MVDYNTFAAKCHF